MSQALAAQGVSCASDQLIALRRIALHAEKQITLAALPGGFTSRRRGQGLEVDDLREYVDGDDFRHLDHVATARTGKMHVRRFVEERDRACLLIADFRPSMFWGLRRAFRSVAAAEALSMIGWRVVESGGRVALLALTPEAPVITSLRGRARGMLDVIGGLTQAHKIGLEAVSNGARTDAPLDQALSQIDRLTPPGAEVTVASGFDAAGDDLPDRLDAIAQRRDVRLIFVTDAHPTDLPRGRYPIRLADGRAHRVALDIADASQDTLEKDIAGRRALVVNAGDSVEEIARRLAAPRLRLAA